jgi:HSP20 family molecular chaperone IbpA
MTNKLAKYFNDPFFGLFPSSMGGVFDEFFRGLDLFDQTAQNLALSRGFPKGGMFVEDGKLNIEFVLAGYKREQLSVVVEDNKMIISADKCEGDDKKHWRASRAFKQTFSNFDQQWNLQNAEVTFEDGLLRVIVPPVEKEEKKSVKLNIK